MGGITTASSTPSPMSMSTPGLLGHGVFTAQQEQRAQHPGQEAMARRGSSQYSLDLRRQQEQQLMRLVAQRQQREKREGSVASASKSSPVDGHSAGPNGRHVGNGRNSGQRTPMDVGEMGGGQRTPMDMNLLGDGLGDRGEFERGVAMEHQRREHARQMEALAGYHRPQQAQQQHPSQHQQPHHHHTQHHPQLQHHQVTHRPDYQRPASSMGAMQSDGYYGTPRQGDYHPHLQHHPQHNPQHHPQHSQHHPSYPSFEQQQHQQHRSQHQPPPDSYGLGDWNLVSMNDGGVPAFIDDGLLAGAGAGNVENPWNMEDFMRPGGMGMGVDGVDDFKMLG